MTSEQKNFDSSRTINRQQEQKQHEEHEEHYYYNNYSPARACACAREDGDELPPMEAMQKIAEAYRANVNTQITAVAAGVIERALKNGMEPATVILAIEETGMASRPSPYYLSAVLRHWAETGVVLSKSRGGADVTTTEARPWWR